MVLPNVCSAMQKAAERMEELRRGTTLQDPQEPVSSTWAPSAAASINDHSTPSIGNYLLT